jgi:hypothetical protein
MTFGKAAFQLEGVPIDSACGVGIGAEYPAGSCVEHLFGGSPWFGAIVSDTVHDTQTRAVFQGYNGDEGIGGPPTFGNTIQDKIWQTSTADSVCDSARPGYYKCPMNRLGYDDDHDGKIDEDELDGLDNDHDWIRSTDDIGADGIPDSMEVGCKGKYDPVKNPDPAFDDYDPAAYDSCHPRADGSFRLKNDKTIYTELNGIPDHGEPHVDEDFGAVSDNDLYTSTTDTSNVSVFAKPVLGVKIFSKSYAYRTSNENENAMLPIDFYFINVGHSRWDSVYIGFFADADVGPVSVPAYYTHNYSAYDTATRTAYVANPVDSGSTPLGLTILSSSIPLKKIGRLMFHWWSIGGGPGPSDSIQYAWLSGGAFPNQLIQPNESTDSLADTRFLISVGPFGSVSPNDTVHIRLAFVSGNCVNGCPGSMLLNAATLQQWSGESTPTSIPMPPPSVPKTFVLHQSYPNPFNPVATLSYDLPVPSKVTLTVYDVLGRQVAILVDGVPQDKGFYYRQFNGSKFSSGVYFYRLRASSISGPTVSYTASGKMVLTK